MKRNYRRKVILIFIFSTILLSLYSNSLPNSNILDYDSVMAEPLTNVFSKDDYEPILDAREQGLGSINVTKMSFDQSGIFNQSATHFGLVDDLNSGALNISYLGTELVETVKIAQFDNLDDSVTRSNTITILINESISIQYNNSIATLDGYLIYSPRLYPRKLTHIFVQNQTSDQVEELDVDDYSVDGNDYIVFDYDNYYKNSAHNFSMNILFEYTLSLSGWALQQNPSNELEMTSQEHTFTPSFSYTFTLRGNKIHSNISIPAIPANDLYVELIIDPLDRDDFLDHELKIDSNTINDFLEPDNRINVSMSAGGILFNLEFNLNFTLRFEDPVDFTWAIDRLYHNRDIRERIYIPSLISGPEHIYLHNVSFIESTIIEDQINEIAQQMISANTSIFGRNVNYFDVIVSLSQQSVEYSLIFTHNAVLRKGLKVVLPYLIVGETNPISLKYWAANDLRLILTDIIRMPLTGYKIELYYFDKLYGTYISNEINQPMAPAYSDQNGELLIENVPNGNYTVRVLDEDNLILEKQINTFSPVNVIKTEILQFPLWIVIFGSFSGILVLIGLILYFKKRK